MKKVLILGSEDRRLEFSKLNLQNADIKVEETEEFDSPLDGFLSGIPEAENSVIDLNEYEVVFDLNLDDNPQNLMEYQAYPQLTVIGCAVKESLAEMVYTLLDEAPEFTLVGFNALPTFIDRSRLEVSLYDEADRESLAILMQEFGMEYEVVADRVGMVTPRVVCMIINEACFLLGEGTADVEGVDRAMKLGTNYPRGPFEWADAMGIENVYDVISALKADTGEEKYKMAPLLKQYYLKSKQFYS